MSTSIILLIVACALVLSTNARILNSMKGEDEEKILFPHPLSPFLGGHGLGRPGFGAGPGLGFGPFGGISGESGLGGGGMGFGAGTGTEIGSGSGFGSNIGSGFGSNIGGGGGFGSGMGNGGFGLGMGNGGFGFSGDNNGGNSPNGDGEFAGGQAEGVDAALGKQKP
ncbi:hypothetical protein FXO38_19280 [Capsicum annuum]|uniref:glycine-rich cell wall structural protein 2-like n=1 Tax=Capsicum annuum TaxID=4072 RepID=UPI0007BF54B7|nr:glycine-rich cell wall structural protein 2-like [Capsicum annuum]KAF3646184.1 hypothetical protein FXO38_19280 [Capsicum annuum]KAF3667377.1 hypothetical protein FXO37_10044 [Capsicum annuum]